MIESFHVLELRDGFFAKDGRGWYTNVSGHTHSVNWPFPSTIAGALRTWAGFLQEKKQGQQFTSENWLKMQEDCLIRTVLAMYAPAGEDWNIQHRVWPHPADAMFQENSCQPVFLNPQPPAGNTLDQDFEETREALWYPRPADRSKPQSPPAWWNEKAFISWLLQKTPAFKDDERITVSKRRQTHLKITSETQTAEEGMLFSTETVEGLVQNRKNHFFQWGMALHVRSQNQLPQEGLLCLAGKRHINLLRTTTSDLFTLPIQMKKDIPPEIPGIRVICVTPTIFKKGWLPDGFQIHNHEYTGEILGHEAILRAAFVPRAQAVSGWDMVRQAPKSTLRLVPPGSVFFFQKKDASAFTPADIEKGWLGVWGDKNSDGYGTFVTGIWNGK